VLKIYKYFVKQKHLKGHYIILIEKMVTQKYFKLKSLARTFKAKRNLLTFDRTKRDKHTQNLVNAILK